MCRRAITRIEAAAIVAVLGAVLCGLVVWIEQAREASRRQTCNSNLFQVAHSLEGYRAYRDVFPCATVVSGELPPEKRLSWFVDVMPFLEQTGGGLLVDRTKAWDADVNLPIRVKGKFEREGEEERTLEVVYCFLCPSASPDLREIKPGPTSYVGIAGIGEDAASLPARDARAGVFGYDRATRPGDITKKQSDVALLAETALDNGPWTAGGRPTVRGIVPEDAPCLGVGRQFGGNHPGGGNAAFVDGSVRFLADDINPDFFAAMATVAGEGAANPTDRLRKDTSPPR